jgi:hypothetical protein
MTKIKPDVTETNPFVIYPPDSNVILNLPKPNSVSNFEKDLLEKFNEYDGPKSTRGKVPDEIQPLKDKENIFQDTHAINNSMVLQKLGFEERSATQWYHPVLGDDMEHNWLHFDTQYDDTESIVPKIYKTGFVQGQKNIRMGIKKVLDI